MVAVRPAAAGGRKPWVPGRQDIIWIGCNPQVGREMRDVHPFLVLSPDIFNQKTSLVIGLPMTTAEYNSDNPFAVAVSKAPGRKTGQTSFMVLHEGRIYFEGTAVALRASQDAYLQEFLFMTLPPW